MKRTIWLIKKAKTPNCPSCTVKQQK